MLKIIMIITGAVLFANVVNAAKVVPYIGKNFNRQTLSPLALTWQKKQKQLALEIKNFNGVSDLSTSTAFLNEEYVLVANAIKEDLSSFIYDESNRISFAGGTTLGSNFSIAAQYDYLYRDYGDNLLSQKHGFEIGVSTRINSGLFLGYTRIQDKYIDKFSFENTLTVYNHTTNVSGNAYSIGYIANDEFSSELNLETQEDDSFYTLFSTYTNDYLEINLVMQYQSLDLSENTLFSLTDLNLYLNDYLFFGPLFTTRSYGESGLGASLGYSNKTFAIQLFARNLTEKDRSSFYEFKTSYRF